MVRLMAVGTVLAALALGIAVSSIGSLSSESRLTTQASAMSCSEPYLIQETFENGARWSMCWEVRNATGLVIQDVRYTPPGGTETRVLRAASMAEIHVPYDAGKPRYLDIGEYGFGTAFRRLGREDCPQGQLFEQRGEPLVCGTVSHAGYAYRSDNGAASSEQLTVHADAKVAYYDNIISWSFRDDGTIISNFGVSGSLDPEGYHAHSQFGGATGPNPRDIAASHMHDLYWRLDFDVAGPSADRVIQENTTAVDNGYRLKTSRRARTVEGAFTAEPMQRWVIQDSRTVGARGLRPSWQLDQVVGDEYHGGPDDTFARNDLYLTNYKDCEWLAARNANGRCEETLDQFVNLERVSDPVIWVHNSWHHVPRPEEGQFGKYRNLPTHWFTGFTITPRAVSQAPIY